mmetsp:Transcript_86146/g.149091  ORF Transcript_86146/g.149091 Transcript_86146/m.149091 type:complete len:90 (-) Transcript_86146:210-479(-)
MMWIGDSSAMLPLLFLCHLSAPFTTTLQEYMFTSGATQAFSLQQRSLISSRHTYYLNQQSTGYYSLHLVRPIAFVEILRNSYHMLELPT